METVHKELSHTDCITCGVTCFFSKEFHDRLRITKQTFYCPNGHTMAYTKGTLDELRDKIKEKDSKIFALETKVRELETKPKRGRKPKK